MNSCFSCSLVVLVLLLGVGLHASYAKAQALELAVPSVSQVPDGVWVAPWNEACEEATLTMVQGFYTRHTFISKTTSKQQMRALIDWENAHFHHNQDTDATEMVQLAEHLGTFTVTPKRSPTLEEIKRELNAFQPVIALVDMYKLYGQTPRRNNYHTVVLIGYDDLAHEFIVRDPARAPERYSYTRVLQALHDYNPVTALADKEATVLFTRSNGL